ncbi:TPA: LPXTG cell wall anchor domain-containing protein [Streptococcus suis 92-1191]|uniref:LPXTG cell wall anchor domain-containing protein n=1 Tax=Streptococcus suis TaxID=1307 RepID=UPI000406E09C|nr:LPXTG cell wall anchor domain-containing protein [Streptococcus suis]HEM3165446.1 LPXTG cell wall anchor domain-containing protein [Streptococcus suis 92-1191]
MKRSSRKKRLAKWSKLGLSLAAVTVLGGLVEPVGLTNFGLTKVYATEQADPALEARKIEIKTMIQSYRDLVGQIKALNPADYTEESWNKNYDGDVRIYLGAQSIATAYNDDLTFSSLSLDGVDSHQTLNELNATYMFGYIYVENSIPVLKQAMADLVPVSESVETPTDKPAENSVEQPEPAGDTNSTDTNTVNYTIQLVDQDGQVLQTIQQSGVEGTEVSFDFPVISGYRVGKTEGFDSWTYGKGGTFRLVANKTVKVYYDKAPSIDSLIRPEQRVEYQKVFDTFHTTVLKAFEVYKKELGVDHIIRLTEDEAKFNQITQSEDLTTLQLELILVENLFNEPVGLVLTDQDIINAIGWTPEYWDYQIAYHKEITQKLEKAMANIAASKAIPTVPVDQSITIKAVYTEEQIEPGQKVDVLKEIEYTLKPGESVVLEPLTFEGWTSRVVQESQTVTYEEAKARPNKEYYFYYIEEGTTPTEKPVETPAEKQVISSEVKILNLDGSTYWKGEGLDKAVVGTTTVELEVGGDLTIPATVVPEGYEITDVRFNVLSTGVKELPHTWTYEEYKNYTSAPMSVPEIDILVKPVSSPATPVTPPAETPLETPANRPAETPTNQLSADQAEQSATEPTVLSEQGSQAGTASPTEQSASEKQATKQGDKEPAAPASQSKQSTAKPTPTSQSQAKSLPATGEVSSVLHLTGLGLLGLAGLVVKRRQRKSS